MVRYAILRMVIDSHSSLRPMRPPESADLSDCVFSQTEIIRDETVWCQRIPGPWRPKVRSKGVPGSSQDPVVSATGPSVSASMMKPIWAKSI
jgi:hypothetical protein